MIIQVNTDNNIEGKERLNEYVKGVISESLDRFSGHITRVEVHLSDENGQKEGADDKRCLLEARVEGLKPVVVTNFAENLHKAVDGAINKMKSALDSAIGKIKEH
ncbi:HPF/RaiA family ribosome-associated protein [Pedobacter glucosidilyticus]|uniref:HPF/RaiA family ribosome-associated protein n=1 Tax=Pedobacter glucosidilyticus TaxID=1122941 RepID=UPI00040B0F1D|nr:HPF/RaiA family ribosome-associated protein [Pedobacter glucosidilyticus]